MNIKFENNKIALVEKGKQIGREWYLPAIDGASDMAIAILFHLKEAKKSQHFEIIYEVAVEVDAVDWDCIPDRTDILILLRKLRTVGLIQLGSKENPNDNSVTLVKEFDCIEEHSVVDLKSIKKKTK